MDSYHANCFNGLFDSVQQNRNHAGVDGSDSSQKVPANFGESFSGGQADVRYLEKRRGWGRDFQFLKVWKVPTTGPFEHLLRMFKIFSLPHTQAQSSFWV